MALNFKDGKILTADLRHHRRMEDVTWCSSCSLLWEPGDRGWVVKNKKALCPECQKIKPR